MMNDAAQGTTATPPLPSSDELSRPFWQGVQEGKLRFQMCASCARIRYPDAPVCAKCLSPDSRWVDVASQGRVVAWCRFHRAYFEGFPLPHTVLLVELEAGVRLYANLSVAFRQLLPHVGMAVVAAFEATSPDVIMPRFRPALAAQDT